MSKKIFVRNLSYRTTEGELSNLFEQELRIKKFGETKK
jgi:RNA recognition motif-containing protein